MEQYQLSEKQAEAMQALFEKFERYTTENYAHGPHTAIRLSEEEYNALRAEFF